MAEGRIIAEGPPDELGSNQQVIDAYLGAHHDAPLSFEEEERALAEDAELIAPEVEEPCPTPPRPLPSHSRPQRVQPSQPPFRRPPVPSSPPRPSSPPTSPQ